MAEAVTIETVQACAGADPQPSFPVHFRTVDDPSSPALPGVVGVHERAVMEAHTDPHDGCPACDAWRAKYDR